MKFILVSMIHKDNQPTSCAMRLTLVKVDLLSVHFGNYVFASKCTDRTHGARYPAIGVHQTD